MSITTDPFGPGPLPGARRGWPRRARAALWGAFNGLQLAFTLLWTAALISLALAVHVVAGRRWPLRMASRAWAPGLLWGAGARLEIEGAEQVDWSRPQVLVCNHQSVIDICALFRAVPVPLHFALKQEMRQVPFVARYAQAMGMLFIERSRRGTGMFLRHARVLMAQGATLCIFPEGTRSSGGTLAPFKGGAFQIALDAGVPVLPVALSGSGAVLPRHGLFRVRPGTIRVRFGAPLAIDGASREALAARAQAAVQALLDRDRT
jgi:1-acyl-sn-glycerol-3-phosphate acyltransferase